MAKGYFLLKSNAYIKHLQQPLVLRRNETRAICHCFDNGISALFTRVLDAAFNAALATVPSR